jgi:hypothetical protein
VVFGRAHYRETYQQYLSRLVLGHTRGALRTNETKRIEKGLDNNERVTSCPHTSTLREAEFPMFSPSNTGVVTIIEVAIALVSTLPNFLPSSRTVKLIKGRGSPDFLHIFCPSHTQKPRRIM